MVEDNAKTVLVVEDNPANMELAVELLEVRGFRTLQAATAEEGICRAKAERPSLILMDIGLPGMDGLAATRLLKQDAQTAGIPVVALTAQAMEGDREKTLAAGCLGYITKPIDTRTFAQTITLFLSAQRS
jgi:CheY-like chemotaxis protein